GVRPLIILWECPGVKMVWRQACGSGCLAGLKSIILWQYTVRMILRQASMAECLALECYDQRINIGMHKGHNGNLVVLFSFLNTIDVVDHSLIHTPEIRFSLRCSLEAHEQVI